MQIPHHNNSLHHRGNMTRSVCSPLHFTGENQTKTELQAQTKRKRQKAWASMWLHKEQVPKTRLKTVHRKVKPRSTFSLVRYLAKKLVAWSSLLVSVFLCDIRSSNLQLEKAFSTSSEYWNTDTASLNHSHLPLHDKKWVFVHQYIDLLVSVASSTTEKKPNPNNLATLSN